MTHSDTSNETPAPRGETVSAANGTHPLTPHSLSTTGTVDPAGIGSNASASETSVGGAFGISIELMPEAALVFLIDGTLVAANSTALALFRAEREHFIGSNLYSLGPIAPDASRQIVEQLKAGQSVRFDFRIQNSDGAERIIEAFDIPLRNADGQVDRVVGFGRDVTAQRRAEREQALLAAIVSSTDDAVVSVSPDGRIITWNHGAEELFGASAAEALGQPCTKYFPPEERDSLLSRLAQRMAQARDKTLGVVRLETRLLRKDGSSFDAQLVISGVYDSGANLLGLSGIANDITARKQLERSQATFASIVENSGDAIVTFSHDQRITSFNRGAERLLGFTAEEALGRPVVDLYVPEQDRELVNKLIAEDFAAFENDPGSVRELEAAAQRKDGSLVEVSLVASGVFDSAGKLLGLATIMRDITRRKRAEAEQSMLATIVNASDDAIVSTSLDNVILTWNRGAETLFGLSANQALGRTMLEFIPPEESSQVVGAIDELLRTRKPVSLRLQSLKADGTRFASWVRFFPACDQNGNIIAIGAIGRDITEQLKLQAEQAALATIVNASQDAIIGFSKDLRITHWNAAAASLYGFSTEEALGHGFDLFVPPDQLGAALAADRRLFETGEAITFQQRAKKRDGSWFDSLVNIFPIRDASGQIIAGAGIGRDISDLLRLQRDQAALATIVDASQDPIISISTEGRITSWNRAAQKIFEHTAAEAIGHGLDFFLPPGEVASAAAATKRVAHSGEPATLQVQLPQKDGTVTTSLVNLFPIRDADGKIIEVSGIGHDITKIKQIEAELREAHEYTRGLIESSVDAMVIVDPELRITDGNDQLARLTELPKKTLFGSRFDSHFADPVKARAAVQKALTDGFVTNIDLTLVSAGGKRLPVSFNASLFYRAGKVFGIFGVARDVSEQRAMEHRLREEREYSKSLVQSSPDGLLVADSALMLTDANERALELTGYSREELVGGNLAALFTDPVCASEALEKARENTRIRDVELTLLSKTAREIPVSLSAWAINIGGGAQARIVAALRDITEKKLAEKANALLAAIVGSSADAIYSESADMTITSWNPAAEKLFGYAESEVVGRSAAMMVPLDRRAELTERVKRICRNRQAEKYETVRIRKDGTLVEVAVTHSPILDSAGRVTALSVTVRDISERRRMEAELTKARDAALETARVKAEFLANMSHEIRTPLNSIIGMTGLLLDTELSAEQREFAGDIHESGDALLNLINQILDFSKISAGRLTLEEVDFELTSLVEGTVELIAGQARGKGLKVTSAIDSEVPRFLRGDPGRLHQVLTNLLGNAVKFTEHGEVAVQVSKLSENPKEAVLRFEVRDTGIGIPSDKLAMLFQPFTQADASTSRHYGGTGLGLSIAKELAVRMGGSMSVASTPNVGSTFWFSVKLAKQIDTSQPASDRFAALTGVKVMIVDDNARNRESLERQLAAWGMRCSSSASAAEALNLLRGAVGEYQVALLDVMMPDVGGIELARTIKSDPALSSIAIIFLSSAGSRADFQDSLLGLEIKGWLMKPVPESSLYNALSAALRSPAKSVMGAAAAPGTSVISPGQLKLSPQRRLRILLAEDNPINQKMARLQLKKLGLEVDAVANGREAVEAAMRTSYDAVLMDCQMPEMDGYDATREIRRRERGARHTPIIAMTAHALPGDRDKCLGVGMDEYISKPVALAALENVLVTVLAPASEQPACAQPGATFTAGTPAPLAEEPVAADAGAAADRATAAAVAAPLPDASSEPPSISVPDGSPANDICERETIDQLRLEGGSFLHELIDLFRTEVPGNLQNLAEAMKHEDAGAVRLIAHTLKGTAGTFGAKRMRDLAAGIEMAARADSLPEASRLLDSLRTESQRVRDLLEAEDSREAT